MRSRIRVRLYTINGRNDCRRRCLRATPPASERKQALWACGE
jgi:hypothetical protein